WEWEWTSRKKRSLLAVSNVGLGRSDSERLSATGISEGVRHRDELVSNFVVETESPIREHGSPTLTGATTE
uniref:hypothetical protein n=1 Tax=Haloquadratum walsbyi TaxID=293091 RepID=UPI0023F342F3